MKSKDSALVVGVILVGLIFAALAWFLAVSPRLAAAQEARTELDEQIAINAELRLDLAALRAESLRLPEYREVIYAIRDYFPPEQQIEEFRVELDAAFRQAGLEVLSEAISDPGVLVNEISLAAAAGAVGLESPVEGLVFTGLSATPFAASTVGPLSRVMDLLDILQTGDHRYFLLTGLTISVVEADGPIQGVAARAGDVQVSFTGLVFTLNQGDPTISRRPIDDEDRPDPFAPQPDNSDRNFIQPGVTGAA